MFSLVRLKQLRPLRATYHSMRCLQMPVMMTDDAVCINKSILKSLITFASPSINKHRYHVAYIKLNRLNVRQLLHNMTFVSICCSNILQVNKSTKPKDNTKNMLFLEHSISM